MSKDKKRAPVDDQDKPIDYDQYEFVLIPAPDPDPMTVDFLKWLQNNKTPR